MPGVHEERAGPARGESASAAAAAAAAAAGSGAAAGRAAAGGSGTTDGNGLERDAGAEGLVVSKALCAFRPAESSSGGTINAHHRTVQQVAKHSVSRDEAVALLQLDKWSVEQAERYGRHLLAQSRTPSRSDIEAIVRRTMCDFQARTRAVDRDAKEFGSKGWTLGLYVYGNKVGLTNHTLLMPNVVRAINMYVPSTQECHGLRFGLHGECKPRHTRIAP